MSYKNRRQFVILKIKIQNVFRVPIQNIVTLDNALLKCIIEVNYLKYVLGIIKYIMK